MKKNKILIVGKIPPPIGGLTIHVSRLLNKLKNETEFDVFFYDLAIESALKLLFQTLKYNKIHLHTSSPIFRFLIGLYCKLTFTKCIITFHGDLGRYKKEILNKIDLLTIRIAEYPIVLNTKSYSIACEINTNTKLISSFIAPIDEEEYLCNEYRNEISNVKKSTDMLFCTNAYNLTYDKDGVEIYGIYEIISCFLKKTNLGLVFSDPSGAYKKKFKDRGIRLTENILHIVEPHSFYEVLKSSDASIRNTTTDGDSLSVKESLFLKKTTLCTDVVSRPEQTILYKRGELQAAVDRTCINMSNLHLKETLVEDGSTKIIELYKNIQKNGQNK
jgi:hypothetical protein